MPRALRIEFPGAIYHEMNCGDQREPIFLDDFDPKRFLTTLAGVCAKTDWQPTQLELVSKVNRADVEGTERGAC